MEDEQVKDEVIETQEQPKEEPQIQPNVELEKLKLENEQLRTQLAKAELEKDEAQKAFLNKGNTVTPPRDFKTLVEDIE